MKVEDLLKIIEKLSVTEKLRIARNILESLDNAELSQAVYKRKPRKENGILKYAGILSEEEAVVMGNLVKEARKICD